MRIKHSYAEAFRTILLNSFLWLFTIVNAQESQEGYASFYHDNFHGRRTACGERFDNNSFTCAHRSLPFGTKVEITNLNNGKYIVATVNDRGPYVKNRIVDVTKRVAQELEFQKQGVAMVNVKVLRTNELNPYEVLPDIIFDEADSEIYGIKLGTYDCREKVKELSKQLMNEFGVPVFVRHQKMAEGVTYKVFAGSFNEKDAAEQMLSDMNTIFPNASVEAYIVAK